MKVKCAGCAGKFEVFPEIFENYEIVFCPTCGLNHQVVKQPTCIKISAIGLQQNILT